MTALSSLSVQDPRLQAVRDKVVEGVRLGAEDGLLLYESPDLMTVGALANRVRDRLSGNAGYYVLNRHINPTNICVAYCKLCAFGRPEGVKGAYTLDLEEIYDRARPGPNRRYSELHIVGGHHPTLPFDFYLEMVRGLKQRHPDVHIKAFTMAEVLYFSQITGAPTTEVLSRLKEAGLDAMPGGGAEIFDPIVRQRISRGTARGEEWLLIAEEAHRLGIRTNATMLYGHVEEAHHRVEHLLALRELQDRTGGFLAFIPLAFHPPHTGMSRLPFTGGILDLKSIAVARLLLDNIPHIKAYWIQLGEKLAQVALSFGADDLDGTVVEEHIYHDAGAPTGQELSQAELERLIRDAGRDPVERDAFYRPVTAAPTPAQA